MLTEPQNAEDPRMTSSKFLSERVDGNHLQSLLNRLDFDGFSIEVSKGGGIFPEGTLATGNGHRKWMYRVVAVAKHATHPVLEELST